MDNGYGYKEGYGRPDKDEYVEPEQPLDTSAPPPETTNVLEEKKTPDTSAPPPETTDVLEEKQTLDTSAPTAVDADSVAVAAQGDVSVKRSASPKSDARDVNKKVDNNSHYITLYNEAINKIFKYYTTYTSFHNPKQFRSLKSSLKSDTDTCRNQFLSFMSDNFWNFDDMNVVQAEDNSAARIFHMIVEKVKQFINLMEVEMKDNQIVVTLHDIIKKLSSTSSVPDYCISEKLFMAILLAIQILHCPTPSAEYTLKFKFAPSLFGKSSLQQSSIKCTNNSVMSNLKNKDDPVAANIFDLKLRHLQKPPLELKAGGSKSRRRHRRHHKSKHARKTRRGRSRKFKLKTHRRRSARKNKKIYKNTYKRCK
jgi:hypothetical protein